MIIFISALIGAVWGGWMAKRRGGNRKDIAQYAVVMAIALSIAAMILRVILVRMIY